MSERWAILIIYFVVVAGWSFFAFSVPAGNESRFALFGLIVSATFLPAWWIGADAQSKGLPGLRWVEGWLLLLLWPVGLGAYLIRSRGLAVGIVSLLGFLLLCFAAMIAGGYLATDFLNF